MNNKNEFSEEKIKKGSDIFVEILEKIGVKTIYHYPGGTLLDVNQSLSKTNKIRTVLSRNEQGSGFSAVGAAQVSGKTQLAMGISGPGSTNLMTPIGDAYLDSVPVVFVAGQVPQDLIGNMAFQEIDFNAVVRPIVKKDFLIKKAIDIPKIINEAFEVANSSRPGPVVVVIPKDVQQEISKYTIPENITSLKYKNDVDICDDDYFFKLKRAKELLKKSKKPLIYAGGGVISSDASSELTRFAIDNNIPVTTTLKGLGAFDETNDLSLGMLGMHGMYYTNKAVEQCDLLFALGVRFDDRVASNSLNFAPNAKIIHVDVDEKEINKNKKIDIGIKANVKIFLNDISDEKFYKKYEEWFDDVEKWRKEQKERTLKITKTNLENIVADDVFNILNELTNGESYIVTSVGKHQMQTAQKYKFKFPRHMITSGGFGTMGFCLPASIGVDIEKKYKNKETIVITGDGSFQMNIQELGTIAAENLKPKIIIFNNYKLGMVTQWEDKFYNENYADTDFKKIEKKPVDFVKIAEAYNIKSVKVTLKSNLRKEIINMFKSDEAYVLDVDMIEQDHILPMIPSGLIVDNTIF